MQHALIDQRATTDTTRRAFLQRASLAMIAGSLPLASCVGRDLAEPAASKSTPRALLLGDSISMGYTNYVKGMLYGSAEIARPLNTMGRYLNCEGTSSGVRNIDAWLGDGRFEVIHFNFGLHDLKHVDPATGNNSTNPQHPQQATLEQYTANLHAIVAKLKATRAKLIFATTTPFPDQPTGPLRRADQVVRYNDAALGVMREHGVAVNDLHGFVLPRMEALLIPNNVHFTEAGRLELAAQVARHLKVALDA